MRRVLIAAGIAVAIVGSVVAYVNGPAAFGVTIGKMKDIPRRYQDAAARSQQRTNYAVAIGAGRRRHRVGSVARSFLQREREQQIAFADGWQNRRLLFCRTALEQAAGASHECRDERRDDELAPELLE